MNSALRGPLGSIQIFIIKFTRRVPALFAAAPFNNSTAAQAAHKVKLLGQHQNAQWDHPEPDYGQKPQYAPDDQRHAHNNAPGARLRQFEGAVAYAKVGHGVSCGQTGKIARPDLDKPHLGVVRGRTVCYSQHADYC